MSPKSFCVILSVSNLETWRAIESCVRTKSWGDSGEKFLERGGGIGGYYAPTCTEGMPIVIKVNRVLQPTYL